MGAQYLEGWIDESPSVDVVASLSELGTSHYPYRGNRMKRAPKKEFYYPGHETATYRWGQTRTAHPGGNDYTGMEMPPWMIAIADRIRSDFGEEVNHAIAIEYSDGTEHWAPAHKDKIPPGTSFFVLSFGTPRKFQLLDAHGTVVWEEPLSNGSLLVISGELNQTHLHAVPKDKMWAGNPRWSLIFRTIH